MAKGCFGISLDLERGRLNTVILEVGGKNHDTRDIALTPGKHEAMTVPAKTEAVLGLPERAVHTRYVEMPAVKADALDMALRSKATRYFPFQAAHHTLTYAPCPSLGDRKKKGYVLFVLEQHTVKDTVEWLAQSGVKIDHMEFRSVATQRWINWEKPELRKGAYVWVDFCEDEVLVGLSVDMLFYGSRRLRPTLCQLKGWDQEQPLEDFLPYVDALAHQVASAVAFFNYRLTPTPLDLKRVVVTGLHCQDPTLLRALQTVLGMEPQVVTGERLALGRQYRVSAGLSLRNVEV